MAAAPGLTPDQLAAFDRDGACVLIQGERGGRESCKPTLTPPPPDPAPPPPGFLVLPSFAPPATVAALLAATAARLASVDEETAAAASVFSTTNQSAVAAPYFLASAAAAAPFFEADAVDPATKRLREGVAMKDAVNKIGHALHDVDPTFKQFTRSLTPVFRSLRYAAPTPVQSMLICKGARVGGEVVPHQDSAFLWTTPAPSVVGCWLALHDASVANGCLFAVPGSHRAVPIGDRFVRSEAGGDADGGGVRVGFQSGARPTYDTAGAVPLPAPAGTLVLLHGGVVHFSAPNASAAPRAAFTVHVVEGGRGHAWAPDNWLQRPAGAPFVALYEEGEETA